MTNLSSRRPASGLALVSLALLSLIGFIAIFSRPAVLQQRRRQLLQLDPKSVKSKRADGARFLALGSINSYSYNMADAKERKPAYPYLLSPDTPNYSQVRDVGALYPALCLHSLAGHDDSYNVILLDYSYMLDTSAEDLQLLATRLRNRYPSAIIIFLRIWCPRQFVYTPEGFTLREWLAHHRVTYLEEAKELLSATNPDDWSFNDDHALLGRLNSIVQHVGGHVWTFPPQETVIDALTKFGHLFDHDFIHLSAQGHAYVASEMERLIASIGIPESSSTAASRADIWHDFDDCHSWFGDSRRVALKYKNLKVIRVDKWPNPGWALECKSNGCSFQVENSQTEKCVTIYLQFIATEQTESYQVTVGDNAPILLTPSQHVTNQLGLKNPQQQVIVPVGQLDEGAKTSIVLEATTSGKKGKKKLAMTGVLLSPAAVVMPRIKFPVQSFAQ